MRSGRWDRSIGSADAAVAAQGVADIGRLLHRSRAQHGLSVADASARTGIAKDQLRAVEAGQLTERDGLATLRTVRRYADFLGLSGDRLVLAALEDWPATCDGGRSASARGTPAPAGWQQPGSAPTRSGTARHPDRDVAERWVEDAGIGAGTGAGALTAWRHQDILTVLQAAIVVVSFAIIAGAAILAIQQLHPSWLAGISTTHPSSMLPATTPGAGPAVGATTGSAPAGPSSADGAAARPARGAHAALTMHVTSSAAVVYAGASTFVATLHAVNGPCWVDVTAPTSTVYEGVLDAGTSKAFPSATTLVVEMGATSGRLTVESAAGHLASTAPASIPYRFTVRPSR